MSAALRAVPAFDRRLLTFDAVSHRYAYAGKALPSVTQVMQGLHGFAGVALDVLEAARERGTHVHSACHYFDEGDLDEGELDDGVRGYLAGWKRFILDAGAEWSAIEQPLVHPVHWYAGTPDRFGDFDVKGLRVIDGQVDIKTALDAHPCWGVQTAAYSQAAGKPASRRFTVQLRPDGTYRLLEWTDSQDWPVFMSCLTLRTWKERNSL